LFNKGERCSSCFSLFRKITGNSGKSILISGKLKKLILMG
jgi:hypothetical protein